MDAGAADPLRAARPEEGEDKPKPPETADDGYETSNSGEARRKPSSAEPSPAPPPDPSPPPEPPYEPLMRYPDPEPEYRHFEPPHQQENPYQHFPFPKYNDPYPFKREADVPYDMSQHHQQTHHQPPPHHPYGPMATKRDDDVYNGIKRECEDPYSFVEEDPMCQMMQPPQHLPHMHPHQHPHMMHQQMCMTQPKKRGRKKKIKDENGMEIKVEPGMEGALIPRPVKERKKHDRFNGMSEEEVSRRTLPDHLAENLDIIIIGINPGLFAAYKGHHYAGPGNHFWKCLYLSGLTREQMSADEDYKLLNFGIGFTNMVPRATKGSADLTRREIKEGSAVLLDKLQTFRPKVAVFNGKLIYEVFSGKKDFCFGKQPDTIPGTNTYMWVMPSSSARCAQLPRAADKVPYYAALKKFRDFLNGLLPHVEETELVFPDNTSRRPQEEMEIRRLTTEPEPGDTIILEDGTEVPLKKKRGRPKKVKLENGETAPPTPRAPRQPRAAPVLDPNGDQPPKKKRGRPKKIRPEEQQFLLQQQQQQQQQQANSMLQTPLPSMSLPHEQAQNYAGTGAVPGGTGGGGDFPPQLPSPLAQAPLMYHQQMNDNATYFQANQGMESPLDVSNPLSSLGRGGYASPGYAASPRGVYASPRSQGYSPSPARTPQPQFPSSPAAFSAPSPPRAGGGAGAGTGGGGAGGYGSPAPRGGSLYAHSPQPYQHQQESMFQSAGSPARFSQSPHSHSHPHPHPHPHPHHPHPYSREPTPQGVGRAYSRSPGPAGSQTTAPFPQASPGGYGASPHTPYSHHSSPAPAPPPPRTPTYMDQHHHHQEEEVRSCYNIQGGSVSTSSGGSALCAELSSDIGAAISSPAPSPAPLHVDFDPPQAPPQPPSVSQGDPPSPLPSADLHPGSDSSSSLPDYNKSGGSSALSPGGVGAGVDAGGGAGGGGGAFARALYDTDSYSQHEHEHYAQEQGNGGMRESPRLDQLHQHPSMYPTNFSRSGSGGSGAFSPGAGAGAGVGAGAGAFRAAHTPHDEHAHYDTGSPGEYAGVKPKSQDVASKSLSGLESLVDQIPSIAEGPGAGAGGGSGAGGGGGGAGGETAPPAPVPSLPEYAPALYPPYGAYGGAPYPNNGYGGFVGYGGGWAGAVGVMRPAPGYLSEWQYGSMGGYAGVAPAYASPYNAPYYNSYSHPPPAHHQQTHYLSAPPLLELHKNGEHSSGVPAVPSVPSVPSVGFGGFC